MSEKLEKSGDKIIMRLNKLKKKKGNLKRFVASFLAIATIGFQANLVGFASNITGITGNNGVYNINPSQTSGTTGYRQYTNFTLDNGHTANLIFNGINRFINAVDNKVREVIKTKLNAELRQ